MIQRILILISLAAAITCFILSGCGKDDSKQTTSTDVKPQSIETTKQPKKIKLTTPTSPLARQNQLKLNLKVGDRFPLIKTIEQTLSQKTAAGSSVSVSKLELLLAIEVKAIYSNEVKAKYSNGRIRLQVNYQRVKYSHDLPDQKVQYDSSRPGDHVPQAAAVYQGLVGNQFSFWLGADNRVVKLENFDEFLKRCVRHVPRDQREELLRKLTKTTGEEGIANFIDDSIGLLPYYAGEQETFVTVGDSWKRKRQVVRPIPMYYDSLYTLRRVNPNSAIIDVVGTIRPSTTIGPKQPNEALSITVQGGRSFGECTIDRKTGLPLLSEITRYIDMIVTPPNSKPFAQQKMVVTTIRAFPQQGKVKRVSFEEAEGKSLKR